jgi:CRISPR system Cascade subunit CasB
MTQPDTLSAEAIRQIRSPDLTALDWWRRLQRAEPGGPPNPKADPAALARLRRCAAPAEALAEPATIRLCREIGCRSHNDRRVESIAVLAIVLAHVREDSGKQKRGLTLGACLGAVREGGDMPLLSELRLRRLMAARDAVEVLRGFREAVALLGDAAPVLDVAKLLLGWLDVERGERIRTRFLFDYHGASDAAPPEPDDPAAA